MKRIKGYMLLVICCLIPSIVLADNRVINGNDYNIYKKTKADIFNKWQTGVLDVPNDIYDIFEERPSYVSPYKAGVVKQDYINDVVDNLNYYRYMIGVPEIANYPENDQELQIAEVVQDKSLNSGNELTHYLYKDFPRPDDMDLEFYNTGAYANHNIVAFGEPEEPNFFYFDESIYDESNPTAGHRMALLGPEMGQIEYGLGRTVVYGRIHYDITNYDNIENEFWAYPAPGYFPKQDFAPISDWDIFLNINEFLLLDSNSEKNVIVTITNLSTGLVEERSVNAGNMEFDYYCTNKGCAPYYRIHILQPTKTSNYYDGEYEVNVKNLIDEYGEYVDIKYTVSFYDKFENIQSIIKSVNLDLNLYRVYMDGEYREDIINSFLSDMTAEITLESGSVTNLPIESFTSSLIGRYSDNSMGYRYKPVINDLPTWISDDDNVLADYSLQVHSYGNEADYRYNYESLNYTGNISEGVTFKVNSLNTFTDRGSYIRVWAKLVDDELETLTGSKYSVSEDGFNLTINDLTKEDEGTYYLITIFNPYYYVGTFAYLSMPMELEVNIKPTNIEVNKDSMTLAMGATDKITASILPVGAVGDIAYSSNNSEIVTVDNQGNVVAVSAGDAVITVSSGDIVKEITVSVLNYLHGDMNKNGKIDLPDVIMILKIYLGSIDTDEETILVGDMNSDGVINLQDVIFLLRRYLSVN